MIAAGVLRSDQGKPDPFHGYHITAYTTAAWRRSPRRLCVDLLAGNADPYSTNAASLSTDFDTVPDPAIITYEIFKSAVLALGECFDAAGGSSLSIGSLRLLDQNRGADEKQSTSLGSAISHHASQLR